MKTLFFDCFCGASGDMILGALLDAGADFDSLKASLATLGVDGYELRVEKVNKHGVMANYFQVIVDESHGHPHRHLHHIEAIIEKGELPQAVKDASLETFRRIAEAEAEVHGTTVQKIHFHEVGAVDSIIDVVGAHLALHQLKPDRIVSSPLHVGAGTVKCAHGVMPVPAPATALLLRGMPSYGGDVQGELVTPTGAALIGQVASAYVPMPAMRVEQIGVGCGTRDLPDRPNILRAVLGESSELMHHTETIVVVEANIDDMNPEFFPPLIQSLIDAGARDAFVSTIMGKKGRPAFLVTALAEEGHVGPVTEALFEGSTTLGLRMRREERMCLNRSWKQATTQWGAVRVKIGAFNGHINSASPEFEDCVAAAKNHGVAALTVYREAYAAAVKGELEDV